MKIKLIGILFIGMYVLYACQKDSIEPDNTQNISIKNTEAFTYNLNISGDEEGAIIITVAKHAKICEITRNAETDYNCIFNYIPQEDYVGTDYVEIETCTGGEGISCSKKTTLRFAFEISN